MSLVQEGKLEIKCLCLRSVTCRRFFQEAVALSSLKPFLDARNVPLYAVVYQRRGAALFQREFFTGGTVFYDKNVRII